MNDSSLHKLFVDRSFFPHQAKFAADFFSSDSIRHHVLVSSAGLGKGRVTAAIVNHAISTGIARRVLLLAPPQLVMQWEHMIKDGEPSTPVMIVDRRELRALEDSQTSGENIWPERAVVILSMDFAKLPDVAERISRCPWDLTVVDEVQRMSAQSQRGKVLLDLVDRFSEMRVLLLEVSGLMTTEESPKVKELLPDAAVTIWRYQDLKESDGRLLLPELHMSWVTYRRRPEEVTVLNKLQNELLPIAMSFAMTHVQSAMLLQSASSSYFALEHRIRRLQQQISEVGRTNDSSIESENESEELGLQQLTIDAQERHNDVEFSKFSEPILRLLEELPDDSKCDALKAFLQSIGALVSADQKVCVFTRFVDTATYLATTLQENIPHVKVITGGMLFAEVNSIIDDFRHNGGILIATETVATDYPEVAAVVFYDLPLNLSVLEKRIGHFVRIGRKGPIRLVALTDESHVLAIEQLQKHVVDKWQSASEGEITKLLISNRGVENE